MSTRMTCLPPDFVVQLFSFSYGFVECLPVYRAFLMVGQLSRSWQGRRQHGEGIRAFV